MKELRIESKVTFSNLDDEHWVVEVTVSSPDLPEPAFGQTMRVYVDSDCLVVNPAGTHPRAEFGWNDYIFDNIKGNVEAAAVIAALAVVLADATAEFVN